MSQAMTPRRRTLSGAIVVVALAVLAVGSVVALHRQGGSGDGEQATSGEASTTIAADPNAPPALNTTGEDWDAIVRGILGFQTWLFTHPRPELLDNIFLPSYGGYADAKLGLSNLATKGWRYDPEYHAASVTVVRLFDRPNADTAVVFVRSFGPANKVVDSSGNVVQNSPGAGDVSVLWTLRRNVASGARWKVAEVGAFSGVPPK